MRSGSRTGQREKQPKTDWQEEARALVDELSADINRCVAEYLRDRTPSPEVERYDGDFLRFLANPSPEARGSTNQSLMSRLKSEIDSGIWDVFVMKIQQEAKVIERSPSPLAKRIEPLFAEFKEKVLGLCTTTEAGRGRER